MALGISLRAGALRLAVRPDLGTCLAGLWHGDTPVLRSTEPAMLQGPRQSACFAMLPYSNRLGHRRLDWLGQEHTLRANFDGSPHTLHGVGWLRPWTVLHQTETRLQVTYTHRPDADWPFPFRAEQHIHLTPTALHMTLSLQNTADHPQPVGLGWHPYFLKRGQSHIDVPVRGRWDNDALHLPSHHSAVPGLSAAVSTLDLDHCFDGWSGTARIRDELFSITLTSDLRRVVVFTPPAQAHFCVEPVSHVNDAIHLPDPTAHGMVSVAPGQQLSASCTLSVEALS